MAPSDSDENPFDCTIDAEDYADISGMWNYSFFGEKKAHIARTGYQYENWIRM